MDLSPSDRVLVLASDGVWDILTSSEAVALCEAHYPDCQAACRALVRKAKACRCSAAAPLGPAALLEHVIAQACVLRACRATCAPCHLRTCRDTLHPLPSTLHPLPSSPDRPGALGCPGLGGTGS